MERAVKIICDSGDEASRLLEIENARSLATIADALTWIIDRGLSVSSTTTVYRADRL